MLYDFHYLGIYVHIAYNSHFGGLKSASEFKFDLRFEIRNLNYPIIIVHVASNSEVMAASKQPRRSHLAS